MADLSPDNRAKLDGIVSQMTANGESDDYIQGVVNDFKTKYAQPQTTGQKVIQAGKDFVSGALSRLNPMDMVKGVADTVEGAYNDPTSAAGKAFQVLAHPYFAIGRAKEALDKGNAAEAAAHLTNAFIDPSGQFEQSQVKAVTPGQRATGLGEMAGAGLAAYGGAKAAPYLARGARALPAPGTGEVVAGVTGHPHVAAALYLRKAIPALADAFKAAPEGAEGAAASAPEAATAAAPPPLPAQPPPIPQEPPPMPSTPPAAKDIQGMMTPPQAHPPFAANQPFSPSRAARQMAPAMTTEEMGVHGGVEGTPITGPLANNPKALDIARRLKEAMAAGQ